MKIDLFKPSVPDLSSYLDFLEVVDRNQTYSNFGPLHHLFKEGLARHFNMGENELELFSNGTMALVAALQSMKVDGRPYCILPSWTFVATVQAVVAAGMTPVFADVDILSMQLTSSQLEDVDQSILFKTSVVLIVSPFGAPLNLIGISALRSQFGFEVLTDCAAGFESTKNITYPTVISLHATKTFGIGEGGLLIAPGKHYQSLLEAAKSYSNFGFLGDRKSVKLGVNAKLSEFHSAVGLGALKGWNDSRAEYYKKASLYRKYENPDLFSFQAGWGESWVSSTCVIHLKSGLQKNNLALNCSEKLIQTRDWWGGGCHTQPIFDAVKQAHSLENTNELAKKTIGIPFYRDIQAVDIDRLFGLIGS